MTARLNEASVDGVLFAPFVVYALGAFAIYVLLLRPLLRRLPVGEVFANPPLVGACLYVVVLAALIALA